MRIVSPRLLGLRFGGVGGFTKAGDMTLGSDSTLRSGKLGVEAFLAGAAGAPGVLEVFTARFFRFRPFFGGALR